MSPIEPSPDDSLVVFRVECPAPTDGRLALLGGEGMGDWNPLAARLGVNYPQNSTTWYIPVYLDLTTENKQTVKFRIVKLDCYYNVTDRDPVGVRTWVLPPGGSSFSLQWGRPEPGSLPQEDLPTKEEDGIDLSLTAWTSHVVGTIKTLHLPSTNGYDFFNSQAARAKLMKYFTYHPDDYQQTADNENGYDVEPDEVRIDIASSGETEGSVNPPPYSSSSTPTIRRIRSVQGAVTPLTRGASRILRRGFSSIGRTFTPTRRRATTRSSPVVAN